MAPYAKIEFADGQVYSPRYDDIYYNRDDGAAESRYVFLQGSHLPTRWQGRPFFCISESGFGTGLNFLVTLQAWLDDPRRCERLDYFSIEAYPLKPKHLRRIHEYWPEYAGHSKFLIEQYPELDRGCHTLSFAQGRVQLHLLFDTLEHVLDEYDFHADCWYLDGFAPAKNPSMWEAAVLHGIASHSFPGASLATFTAASAVRRNLEYAGFDVTRRKGYGRKREMLQATLNCRQTKPRFLDDAPWFHPPGIDPPPENVAVIGAGIAGAQIAWHLAQRGMKVTVIEARSNFACGASGNTAGILAPKFTASPSQGEGFYIDAFLYQLRQIKLLENQGHPIEFSQNGLLQLAHNSVTEKRFDKMVARKDLPKTLIAMGSAYTFDKTLGCCADRHGPFSSLAGSLSPASLCRALLSHPGVELRCDLAVNRITRGRARPELCLSNGGVFAADAVVVANGHDSNLLIPDIPVIPVRGQTSQAELKTSAGPLPAVDHEAYLVQNPANERQMIFGATYQRENRDTSLREEDTLDNLQRLERGLPGISQQLQNIESGHAGVRATTYDRWPLVGPVPDTLFYQREYADIGQGKKFKPYPEAQYRTRLYLLSGLGSRGLCSAAYGANLLAHIMTGQPAPADRHTLHALHPARFLIRELKKKR